MTAIKATASDHLDLVHDLSYDYYGDRMATCSSDQYVKVWEKNKDGDWVCEFSWKAHTASVWRVTWAHPEFGNVLATCSFDRTAAIWEELVTVTGAGDSHKNKSWVKKHTFVDSKTCVSDVKFAPKHLGLQLATCSNDGIVRIYEARDVMNLSMWTLQLEINVKLSCSSLSWCSSIRLNPIIAVGCDDPNPSNGAKVFIYELTEEMRKFTKIESISSVIDSVQDVAFAPNLGRSVNLLAIASKDVMIVQLKTSGKDPTGTSQTKFEQRCVAQFNDHKSTVWRLCWNITGTTLASTGDDGFIRLWKSNYLGTWDHTASLKGDGSLIEREQKTPQISSVMSSSTTNSVGMPEDSRLAQTKRNSGWPYFNTQKDQGKYYY